VLSIIFPCYQYHRLHVERVLIIDVGVQGNISMVFERFRGSGKHINGFEVLGNTSTLSYFLMESTLLRSVLILYSYQLGHDFFLIYSPITND